MKGFLFGFFLIAGGVWAQNVSCALSGVVQDSGGAVFPALEIKLSSAGTEFVRTTLTNQEGFFSFPNLTPSTFTLSITATGFKSYRQSGIELSAGDQRSLGVIRLQLGEVTESVSVVAEANPVMLASGERSSVLTGEEISEIALRGRDFMDAVGLLPGVIDISDSRESPNPRSIGDVYILGGRSNSKNMTIDGVTNMDTGSNGSVHTMPSMDSIGEVKILMSNYSAEHGRNSSGTITVITRGGAKQYRGSAGWYYRHESFSANDYFNNRNGLGRPPYRYNIASYTLNGPLYWPGRFNRDRSKMFFFFSQEFQRQKVSYGAAKTVRVPTALEREGDFSQTFDVNAKRITIYDPLNAQKAFPGNVIPASRFTPVGRKVLDLFPLPNFTDPAPTRLYQWNYISALSGSYPRRTETIRVDYSPRANMQMYLRLSNNSDEQHPTYGLWVVGSVNFPLTPIVFRQPGRGATVHTSATLSQSFFNEFIVGVSQNKLYYFPEFPERVSRKATGIDIPQWNPGLNPGGLIPNMTFSSVPNYANPSMSNGVPYYNSNTIFSFVENLSKVWNTHTLKFGVYIERTRKDQSAGTATRGSISFNRDRLSPLDTNYAYSNALIGVYSNYLEATSRPQGQFRFTNLEFYAQDTWRVNRRVSVDCGLRVYHDLPQYDARLQLASFVPALYDSAQAPVLFRPALDATGTKVAVDPLTGRTYPEALIGTYVPGVGNPAMGMAIGGKNGFPRTLYTVPAISLAPRVGFAWDPFGRSRTAIRGGGGVFFDRIQGNPTMNTLANPPTVFVPTVYYGSIEALAQTSGQGILAPTGTVTSLLGREKMPTVYNYSFGVQQQIGRTMLADISYVGSLSRHFSWQRYINPVPIGARHLDLHPENRDTTVSGSRPLPDNFLRPYQGYGDIALYEFGATSNYNSLQASLNRRVSRGLQFGVAYTFGKILGTASSDTFRVSTFFPPRQRDYGFLSYDRTHVLSVRYNWAVLKLGKKLHSRRLGAITDNWELAGIYRLMSGAPFTPGFSTVDGQDITGTPSESARIDVGDPKAPPLERFARPARGTFGNAGASVLRGPGTNNWDLSLYRTIRLKERKTMQVRFETYNTFNHTQFSSLSTSARFDTAGAQVDPLFLEPTAARSPRRVQLALRLNW
jgi:hypothetical protein